MFSTQNMLLARFKPRLLGQTLCERRFRQAKMFRRHGGVSTAGDEGTACEFSFDSELH